MMLSQSPGRGTMISLLWLIGAMLSLALLLHVAGPTSQAIAADSLLNEVRGRIIFATSRNASQSNPTNYDIYAIDADGSDVQQLTTAPVFDGSPAWSPDGSRIAYNSFVGFNWNIYVMDADGTNVTQITSRPEVDFHPTWSPDGSKIAFQSRPATDPFTKTVNLDIYVVDVTTLEITQLTNTTGEDSSPDWSPDGTQILFVSARDGNEEIYVMNADGSNQTRLTNAQGTDYFPDWSPDGSRIAFESNRDGDKEIYVMNANGLNITQLTTNEADDVGAEWSPDGNYIAFDSTRDSNREIYIMRADGSDQTRITMNDADDALPAWVGPQSLVYLPIVLR